MRVRSCDLTLLDFPAKSEVYMCLFLSSVSNSGPRPTQMTLVPFAQLLNDGPDWGERRGETDVNRKRGFKISKTLYLYSDIYSCRVHFYYIGNVCIEVCIQMFVMKVCI